MKDFFKNNIKQIILFLIVTVLIFSQFFFKGLIPFPGGYLIAWYQPWKANSIVNGTITVINKPIAEDTFRQIYPYKNLMASYAKNFQLPLWNPYNGAGMPLMATMHTLLAPLNILFLVLSGPLAWSIYVIIQPFLMAVSLYLYSRRIGISKIASVFSSILIMLSGFVIIRSIYGEFLYIFTCLPLLLLIIEEYRGNNKTKKILFFPPLIAFCFLSGLPQMTLYVLAVTFLYGIYRLKLRFLPFVFLTVLGIFLSAIQLLPTAELFLNSNMSASSSSFIFNNFLLSPLKLITILIPNYFGSPSTYNYYGVADYIETIAYIGTIPVFFALYSLLNNKKKSFVLFFGGLAILTILSTINWPGSKILFSLPIPLISTGAPTRIFSITTFSLAILAGFGFDYWLSQKKLEKKTIKFSVLFAGGLILTLAAVFAFYFLHPSCNLGPEKTCLTVSLRNSVLELFIFLLGFFTYIFYLIFQKKNYVKKLAPFLIIIFVSAIGLYNAYKFLPFSPVNTFYPKDRLISYLKNHTDGRFFGLGQANIRTDLATYLKIYDPQYYDPLYNKRYGELVGFGNTGKIDYNLPRSDVEITDEATLSGLMNFRRERLFDLLSVKYLIYNKPERNNIKPQNTIWESENWYVVDNSSLPMAYAVENYTLSSGKQQILNALFNPSFNPAVNVVLEEKPDFKKTGFGMGLNQKINIIQDNGNNLSIETSTNKDSLLVLTDNYYPGWKAFIDGQETKIYRANYTFRAIVLPKGNHMIEFIYSPESLKIGIYVSLISALLFCFLTIYILKKREEKSSKIQG